jgi:hypothetical protein
VPEVASAERALLAAWTRHKTPTPSVGYSAGEGD